VIKKEARSDIVKTILNLVTDHLLIFLFLFTIYHLLFTKSITSEVIDEVIKFCQDESQRGEIADQIKNLRRKIK